MSSFWSGLANTTGAVGGYGTPGTPANAAYTAENAALSYQPGGANYGQKAPSRIDAATSQAGSYTAPDRSQYLNTLANGQQSLNTSTQAAISAGMPALQQNLQQQKEDDVRRGISTGDLGTSFEGDITSAFQRNIANATAGQAMNLYNTQAQGYGNLYNSDTNNYLDLLQGNSDRAQAASNAKTSFWGGIAQGALKVGGSLLGL